MTIHHLALLAGLFIVPLVALAIGFRFRKRTERQRSIFWGAVVGHTLATPIASAAAMWPPRELGPDEIGRGALILWTLLAGGVIGALIALVRRRGADRREAEGPGASSAAAAIAIGALAGSLALAACAPGTSDGAAIGTIAEIASPAGAGSREPNLTVAPDGAALLTWTERTADSSWALRLARLEGDRWSEPSTVVAGRPFFVNWADFPSAIALDERRIAVHWLERSAGGTYEYDVRIAQSLDGGRTWTNEVVPHRDGTKSEHGFVSMFDAGRDLLAAVWLDGRKFVDSTTPREMMLAHTTLAADGGLGAEHVLDERICDCCQTSAAIAEAGPVIVYRDRSPGEIRDISIVRLVDGAWTAPASVHEDGWHVGHCPVNGPAVAAEGQRVVVAWFTAARDTARVNVAFSADGGATFSDPIRLDDGMPLGRVDVELLGDDAVVTWLERSSEGDAEVRLRRVGADGPTGAPVVVGATSGARASGFPRMVRQGDRLLFAWTVPGEPSSIRLAAAELR